MTHESHTDCIQSNDLSSIDSSYNKIPNSLPTRHELPAQVVYKGDSTTEWIRHNGEQEVEL